MCQPCRIARRQSTRPREERSRPAAVSELQQLLRSAFDDALVGMMMADSSGRFTRANRAACELLGYTEEELRAHDVVSLSHPDDRAETASNLSRLHDGEISSFQTEKRYLRKDGRPVWVQLGATAVRDDDGSIRYFLSHVQDISARRDAEEALRESEERLRAVFDGASDAMMIADDDRRLVEVNAAAATLLGIPVDEIVGRRIEDVIPLSANAEESWRRFLSEGRREAELSVTRPDGSVRVVEMRATSAVQPNRNLAVLRDVTEHRVAEQSLRETQELYRLVVENTADLVALVDTEGTFVYASPSHLHMLGFEPAELIGTRAVDLLVSEDRGRGEDALGRNTPSPAPGIYRVRAKDGRVVHLEGRITPIAGHGGQPHLTLATSRDISEHVRARELDERLRQAEKMEAIGQVAAGVAHDFNNLLTVINGYSDLALESADGVVAERLLEIRRAGEQAAELTRQLLAFSRKQVLSPEAIDVNVLVTEQRNILQRVLGDDIRIVVDLAREPMWVRADPTQLMQVLLNLAVNARDAMPTGGTFTISTHAVEATEHSQEPHVVLSFADTGPGIEPTILARIFEPFATTKAVGVGTGLGLSTVYGVVEQSGGTIDVESRTGRGTTFLIQLPRVDEAPASAHHPRRHAPSTGGRALVVEDNELVRPLLERFLGSLGYEVVAAAGPREALELAAGGSFDLLITDVVMPEMNGQLLAARLRADHPGLAVLFVSGYTADAVVERGALDESEAFLQKPFTITQLADALASVTGREP